jgi:hypothetical protein
VPGALLDDADRQKQAGLGETVGQREQDHPADGEIARRAGRQRLQQREEHEQVAELRDRRVGRQQLQPFRPQCTP